MLSRLDGPVYQMLFSCEIKHADVACLLGFAAIASIG